jgi:ribosomal protein L31E
LTKKRAITAVKNKLKNHVLKEAKITGIVSIPVTANMATAIDSRTIIFPKNKDGVNVMNKNTSIM